jgi:hypothetical protein
MMNTTRWAVAAAGLFCAASAGLADYDVRVDLKNVSGETKTDWPVILRVYTVLGRNLPAGSVGADGFHVHDPSGREVPHMIEKLPPYDVPGNDEIVFVVPKAEPGEVLRYRIGNMARPSAKRGRIDVVGSAHNLIADGGFESGGRFIVQPEEIDRDVARSGKASLRISADNRSITRKHDGPIKLRQGSWYYFGVWSKTRNVCRFGYQAGGAAHFRFTRPDPEKGTPGAAFSGGVTPQCSTRDWLKCTFESGVDDWGMDRYHAQALGDSAAVEFILQQRRHFYMQDGRTRGTWWLDDAVLMEQPEVRVRHDLAVQEHLKDGIFLFARPPSMPLGRLDERKKGRPEWCAMPYAHERLVSLEKSALRGQRVSFCIGVYHTRPVNRASCCVQGGGLVLSRQGPEGRVIELGAIPVESLEYCPGYLGEGRSRYMKVLGAGQRADTVTLPGDKGVRYFLLTFHVPRDAKPGRYEGEVEVAVAPSAPAAGPPAETRRRFPAALRVQDMVQPTPRDVYVGLIYQGSNPRFDDEGLRVYSRSGFNCITRFGDFLQYEKDAAGRWQVDLEKLHERMTWVKSFGMVGVCVFSDFDVGPKWNGGALLKRTRPKDFNAGKKAWGDRLKTAEAAYKAQIQRIEAARKQHPEWPTLIYMTFDEPNLHGGRNGRPDPAMGWVNQIAPNALTTLDVQFDPLPACLKWYRMPAFDDPANWAGPEIYRWVRGQGKYFGYCGAADKDEAARYQPGMLMISTGGKYFHAWHLTGGHVAGQVAYDSETKKLLRAASMINWCGGMNDLRAYHLLKDAMARAGGSSDTRTKAALAAAQGYLRKAFAVFNGDHKDRWSLQPYLGTAASWGYEQFYDDWQEQMTRHAAALARVQWIN